MLNTKLKKSLALVAAIGAVAVFGSDLRAETIKIGTSAPKTGPLAGGAVVTHWPNVKLWAHDVNARGGLKLKSGQKKIEIIENGLSQKFCEKHSEVYVDLEDTQEGVEQQT